MTLQVNKRQACPDSDTALRQHTGHVNLMSNTTNSLPRKKLALLPALQQHNGHVNLISNTTNSLPRKKLALLPRCHAQYWSYCCVDAVKQAQPKHVGHMKRGQQNAAAQLHRREGAKCQVYGMLAPCHKCSMKATAAQAPQHKLQAARPAPIRRCA